MKLRTKVFLIFTVMSIVPLLFLTLFSYKRFYQTTYQRMDEMASNLFTNAVAKTNSTMDSIRQVMGLFTFYSDGDFSIINNLQKFSDPSKTNDSYEVFKANQDIKFVCQNVLYSYDYIYGLYVFTPSGAVLSHTSRSNGDLQLNYSPEADKWYQETLNLEGSIYVSSVDEHDMFTGKKESLFFAQALHDVYSHEFLGVLVINASPSLFDLSLINTMPGMTLLTITDTNYGNLLYSSSDKPLSGFTQKQSRILSQELTSAPLSLTAAFDYDSMFREFNFTGVLLIVIFMAASAGILILSYALSKNLVYPIEHLSRKLATQKGHSLALSSRYLNRPDEIGTLYNEYNAMAEQLNQSIKRDYQDKLILLDAQMKSLEARINAHFLFNTLEAINSMAVLDDNDAIATMSLALGNMFRYTIKTESELVSVLDELANVDDYVSIQSIRFSNRFRLVIDMEESLKNLQVLKLILQPLVENSLYHGLNYCSQGDLITITGRQQDGSLYLHVIDNGQGMDAETLDSIQKRLSEEASFTQLGHRSKQSIGLTNIHSRLELYYGRGYGLSISSTLNEGTDIQIKLPVIVKER